MAIHFHFGPQPVFSQCLHRHVQVIHSGGMHFCEGQVWDDIQEQVLCLDCLKVLTEAEVDKLVETFAAGLGELKKHV